MSDKKKKPEIDTDKLTREIRRERKFSVSEAIARQGAGTLKGASPVALSKQVLQEVETILDTALVDSNGSLQRTILARLEENTPLLARYFNDSKGALGEFLTGILDSELALNDLVRDTDARWGREYLERPKFEKDNKPAAGDDPYTRQGVQSLLEEVLYFVQH